MVKRIPILLFISLGLSQKEYDLKDIVVQGDIYYKKFSDEIVNGNIYQNFGDNKILLDWFYKKPELEKILPNVFQFKNPIKYWGNFYTTLINQC